MKIAGKITKLDGAKCLLDVEFKPLTTEEEVNINELQVGDEIEIADVKLGVYLEDSSKQGKLFDDTKEARA